LPAGGSHSGPSEPWWCPCMSLWLGHCRTSAACPCNTVNRCAAFSQGVHMWSAAALYWWQNTAQDADALNFGRFTLSILVPALLLFPCCSAFYCHSNSRCVSTRSCWVTCNLLLNCSQTTVMMPFSCLSVCQN
jgi:hypothetical protein